MRRPVACILANQPRGCSAQPTRSAFLAALPLCDPLFLSLSHSQTPKKETAIPPLALARNNPNLPPSTSRPNILLIRATTPHLLDHLLRLLQIHAPLLRDGLTQDVVHLPGHMRRVATDVEVGFLGQQVIDELGILLQKMLHVDFLVRVLP